MARQKHEAMCVISGPSGWELTATYRHGGKKSAAAHVGAGLFDTAAPKKFRLATAKVRAPCVLLSTHKLCSLTTPEQVYGLAQWLIAASMQMTTDIHEEGMFE